MNQIIKQRIEQIQRGEVPEGYKKTKVGIVPIEWMEFALKKYMDVSKEKNIELLYDKDDVFSVSGEYGCVNQIEYLGRSYAGISVAPYGVVYPNDIVYTKSPLKNSPYGIVKMNRSGKIGIVSTLYAIYHCRKNVDPRYIDWYFSLETNLNNYLYPLVNIGAKHDMKISDENAISGKVLFPSLKEQAYICEILDTCNKVIELKEKLLAEKQKQKKWMMQNLLTGKKRLPNFRGKWKELKARDVFYSVTNKGHNANLRVLSATQDKGVIPRDMVNIDIKYDDANLSSYKKVDTGDFVISLRSFQGGIEYSRYTGIVSPAYTVLKPKIKIADGFYKQYFKSSDYISRLNIAVYGIRDGKQIGYEDFGFMEIPYPPFEEQVVISKILSTADQEIGLLQKEIDAQKQMKKALMQLLLTGIIRVDF